MKKFVKILVGLIGVVLLGGAINLPGFIKYKNAIKTLEPEKVIFSSVDDGHYSGTHDMEYVKTVVEFDVEDGVLKNLELKEHKNGKGEPAEVLVDKILEKQSTDVDTISGATASSKAILMAIENAVSGK